MAEDHGFKASSENRQLCVNNCGFFGSPATKNMCSKCHGDLCLKKSGDSNSLFNSTPSVPSPSVPAAVQPVCSPEIREVVVAQPPAPAANRCFSCRKKVGLTGFRCRCGTTFCGTHRYPEKHDCPFDFKSLGREAIAKANPVVKGKKLEKI